MILADISDDELNEMRIRLMMEGIFNRDSKIREICGKMLHFLDGVSEDVRFVREYARFLDGQITEASIEDIAENMTIDKIEVNPHTIQQRFFDLGNLIADVQGEIRELLKTLGAPQ